MIYRQNYRVVNTIIIIFIASVRGAECQASKYRNSIIVHFLPNTYQDLESFPNEDYPNVNHHHRIVKKQMGIVNGRAIISAVNEDNFIRDLDRYERANAENDINAGNSLYNCKITTTNKNMQRNKRSYELLNRDCLNLIRKKNDVIKLTPSHFKISVSSLGDHNPDWKNYNLDNKRENQHPERQENLDGKPCTKFCRVPDETDIHYYYECEMLPQGSLKFKRKRCDDDLRFSADYLECVSKIFYDLQERRKSSKRSKTSLSLPYGGAERSNEWLDASPGLDSKIPSEFKPKPKLKLVIYHLLSKKALKEPSANNKKIKKRFASLKSLNVESEGRPPRTLKGPLKQRSAHHHHPRSFQIKLRKKNKNQEESLNEENENSLDEENEDEDEEEDEEEEEEEEDVKEKEHKKDEKKLSQKEGLRDLFKSAKNALVNRARFTDTSGLSQNTLKLSDLWRRTEASVGQGRGNKVLIDANIKVDGDISTALRNILGNGKKASLKEIWKILND